MRFRGSHFCAPRWSPDAADSVPIGLWPWHGLVHRAAFGDTRSRGPERALEAERKSGSPKRIFFGPKARRASASLGTRGPSNFGSLRGANRSLFGAPELRCRLTEIRAFLWPSARIAVLKPESGLHNAFSAPCTTNQHDARKQSQRKVSNRRPALIMSETDPAHQPATKDCGPETRMHRAAGYTGRAMTLAEYQALLRERGLSGRLGRWCHADMCNSGFQYRVGLNVHPEPERVQDGTWNENASRWFWFAPLEDLLRFTSGHGTDAYEVTFDPQVATGSSKLCEFLGSQRADLCGIEDLKLYICDDLSGRASAFILKPVCGSCWVRWACGEKYGIPTTPDPLGTGLKCICDLSGAELERILAS